MLSGMASDGGMNSAVEIFIGAALTYPFSALAAFLFRRKRPMLVWLPCANILLVLISGAR